MKKFIYEISSIDIKNKRYLVEQRIEPIIEKYSLSSYSELLKKTREKHAEITEEILTAITTNETFFFRDKRNFDEIESVIIPILFSHASHRNIKIWCAACSTGQEPYSVAMTIASYAENHLDENSFLRRFSIIATDINQKVLDKAKSGLYTTHEIERGLPQKMKHKYFLPVAGKWSIDKKIVDMVRFEKMNLVEPSRYPSGVDLILCRNVLIYFDNKVKERIVRQMYKSMNLEGYFVLGASETLFGISDLFDRSILNNFIMYIKK